MNILVLDTSNYNPEFTYFESGRIIVQKKLYSENNADSLIYGIIGSFRNAGRKFSDIGVLGLANGPGSFTGLRVGSASAKGICTAVKCRFVELNSLDIVAEKYRLKSKTESKALALIPVNSKSKEFYFAGYEIKKDSIIRTGEYTISTYEQIDKKERVLLINDKTEISGYEGVTDLSGFESADALHSLTVRKISGNEYGDFRTSEPFYMKDFIPVKKKF